MQVQGTAIKKPPDDTAMIPHQLPPAAGKGVFRIFRGRWLGLLRIVVAIILLAFVVRSVNLGAAWSTVRNTDFLMLAIMLGVLVVDRLIAAGRWYILLVPSERITLWQVLRLILVSGFVGYAVPGSVGVELVRIYGIARRTANSGLAVSSVLVERLFAFFALAALVLLGLSLRPPGVELPDLIWQTATVGLVFLPVGGLMIMFEPFRRLSLRVLGGRMFKKLREKLSEIYLALDMYRGKTRLMLVSFITAFIFQLWRVLLVMVGALALGANIEAVYFFIFIPIIMFVVLLPVSVDGFGVQEVGYVYLFGLVGMAPETALMLSMLLRLMTFVLLIPGALLYWRGGVDL